MSESPADLSMANELEIDKVSTTMANWSLQYADGSAAIEMSILQTENPDLKQASSLIETQLEGGEKVTARDQQTQEALILGGQELQVDSTEDYNLQEDGHNDEFSDDGYEAGSEPEERDDDNDDYDDYESDDEAANELDLKISERLVPVPLAAIPRAQLSGLQDPYSAEDLKLHLFPFLAAEVRLKIWQYCGVIPHIIHVNYEVKADLHEAGVWRICNAEYGGAIRNVCQEARNEVDKVATWEVFKLDNYKYAIDKISSKVTSLINLDIDTVYLNSNALLHIQASRATHEAENLHGRASLPWKNLSVNAPSRSPLSAVFDRKIRHLAIDMSLWRDWCSEDTFEEGSNSCDMCHNPDVYYNNDDFLSSVIGNLAVSRNLKTLTFVEGGEFVSLQEKRIDFHKGWRQSSHQIAGDLQEPLFSAFSSIDQKWTAEVKLATV